MAAGAPSFVLVAVLISIVIVVGGVGVGLVYEYNHPKASPGPQTVQVGDNVSVNYIGLFGSGPEQGKVFDTSIRAVAQNNATYPKSLQYSPRNVTQYKPLPVHVGPTPGSGYNVSGVTYLGVVTGFWRGLVGLTVNETRLVTVPPNVGYGPLDVGCLKTVPLVQTIPTVVTLTPGDFVSTYSGATEAAGATFADPVYGWTDTVLSVNASAVVVAREPYIGETTDPYGWTILVTNVTSQEITLWSQLTPASVGHVLGTDLSQQVCSTSSFLIWSVDLAGGTFVENYNREVVGVTLIFEVTVTQILTPSASAAA